MISVFKREFLGAFRKLHGYITVGATLLIGGLLLWFYNLSYAYDTTNAVFSAMSVVVALIIPVTAVNMFPNRKKRDTDSIYDMMPLTSKEVVLGKYLAALAVTLIPTLVMLLYPVIANMFGSVDLLQSYCVALGYIVFEAALLAVCMLVSVSFKSHLHTYIFSYVVVVAWFLFGTLTVLIPVAPIADIIQSLSIFKQLDVFIYGTFNLKGIVLFLLTAAVFVFLTLRRYERRTVRKKREGLRITGITSVMLSVCIIAGALVINFAAAAAPDTIMLPDMTGTRKQSVGVEAERFLAKTDKDVTIYVLESTSSVVYDMYLKRVDACSDRISVEYVYNSRNPEFYTEKGIDPTAVTSDSLVFQCGDRWQYLSYTDMFLYHVESETMGSMDMTASEYSYYYQMFASSQDYIQYLYALLYETSLKFQGDKQICTYVEYVTADILPQMYYMTGHGVKDITASTIPYSLMGLVTVDISGGIPEDAAGILINMPTEDLTSAEKDALLSYLERGGQITLITDTAALDLPNLCAVLAEYGMSADKEEIVIKVKAEESEENTEEQTTTEFAPALDYDNDILYYLEGNELDVTVDKANAIKRDATVKNKLIHYPLLLTPAEEGSTQSVIACAAETTDNGAHITWFTGGESYNDTKNQAYAPVVYALSWVTMEFTSAVGNIPALVYQLPNTPIESGTTLFVAILTLAPIALMVSGGIIFYKRKKAK